MPKETYRKTISRLKADTGAHRTALAMIIFELDAIFAEEMGPNYFSESLADAAATIASDVVPKEKRRARTQLVCSLSKCLPTKEVRSL